MEGSQKITFQDLVEKVQKQEETIVQLVKIIASTNQRVAEVMVRQENIEENYPMY